jgi:hypothetical protein
MRVLQARGARNVALCGSVLPSELESAAGAAWFLSPDPPGQVNAHDLLRLSLRATTINDAPADIDGVVIVDAANFPGLMRALEPLAHRDAVVVPLDPAWVVPDRLRRMSALDAAWQTSADVNYVSRSGLRGHFLEFGTFWGRSFYPAFFRYQGWLDGRFYAFDSFAGLSAPLALETAYTAGDFARGAYMCNRRSFDAIGDLLDVPAERIVTVEGFYAHTLVGHAPSDYGLGDESVSVCVIDCDLRESTEQVLRFVTPLLEPGALIYFDDWRLCRASRTVGERAAALDWLARHPEFELVELFRDFWQHQWFIFQR